MGYYSDLALVIKTTDYFKIKKYIIDNPVDDDKYYLFTNAEVKFDNDNGNTVLFHTFIKYYTGSLHYDYVDFMEDVRKKIPSVFYKIGEDLEDAYIDDNDTSGHEELFDSVDIHRVIIPLYDNLTNTPDIDFENSEIRK